MITAARGPSSRSAMRSAAYDTESVEPLASEIGRLIFQADVRHAANSAKRKSPAGGYVRGTKATSEHTPATITTATYSRAPDGIACQAKVLVSAWAPSSCTVGTALAIVMALSTTPA